MPHVYAIATMDTKGEELAYTALLLRRAGLEVSVIDVGTQGPPLGLAALPAEVKLVSRETVAVCGSEPALGLSDRGTAVAAMSRALVNYLGVEHAAGRVAGVIGLGGGGGTALIAPALRALPIGLPKLLISTMASGNVEPYVGSTDIAMLYSVVDVAGLNSVSRRILANGAHAIAGMVAFGGETSTGDASTKRARTVAMTMFGVTTTCVDGVRRALEARGDDVLVFHATGTGDRAMENLVRSGLIDGVIDATTTAVADEVVGGVLACGPDRFDAILAARLPYVVSLGALDMVNFGARETVPERFLNPAAGRKLHVHNPQVTLMRTTAEECRAIARWIAAKLNRSVAPLAILIPERGLSALDAEGMPFYDPAADAALFAELERCVEQSPERRIVRVPLHINDPAFGAELTSRWSALAEASNEA